MTRTCRSTRGRGQSGFTVVEVVVVLAVLLLMAGIAVPLVGGYMEDGRVARAEAEIRTLTSAVVRMQNDIDGFPTRNGSGASDSTYTLLSGSSLPTSNPYTRSHSFWNWAASGRGDLIDNHLLKNQPGGVAEGAYPTNGTRRWRGPYTAGPSTLDPWGRPYLINVISGFYDHSTYYKRVFCLSAGPDGYFSTSYRARATDEILGDDVGMIVYEQH